MPSRRVWLLLLLAILLRLLTQGWDSGLLTPHPDERQVAFVSEKVPGFFDDPGFSPTAPSTSGRCGPRPLCSVRPVPTRAC